MGLETELLRLRLAHGFSLRALAARLHMQGHGGLSDYERGRRIPPEDLIDRYEEIFSVPDRRLHLLRLEALARRADRAAQRQPPATHLIAVVDDDPIVRRSVAEFFNGTTVQVGWSVAEPEQLHPDDDIDVVLLDLYFAGRARADAVGSLARRHRLLVISAHGQDQHVLAAMRAGACGYLLKSDGAAAFRSAVSAVIGGGAYLSPALFGIVNRTGVRQLPSRDREVIAELAKGLSPELVALKLRRDAAEIADVVRRALPWV